MARRQRHRGLFLQPRNERRRVVCVVVHVWYPLVVVPTVMAFLGKVGHAELLLDRTTAESRRTEIRPYDRATSDCISVVGCPADVQPARLGLDEKSVVDWLAQAVAAQLAPDHITMVGRLAKAEAAHRGPARTSMVGRPPEVGAAQLFQDRMATVDAVPLLRGHMAMVGERAEAEAAQQAPARTSGVG